MTANRHAGGSPGLAGRRVRDRVQVWHADPGWFGSPDRTAACLDLLDDVERERLSRFRFEPDRAAYLVAHALLRAALSLHAPVEPRRWRFRSSGRGKPYVHEPLVDLHLAFSLSHAPGRVAVAVTATGPVGVDVERADRAGALEEIRNRYLSPFEAETLRSASPGVRRERLLAYWTLKEAYAKARGTGLDEHLLDVSFHLDEGPAIRASWDGGDIQDREGWSFLRASPSPDHAMALAIQRRAGVELEVCVHEARELPLSTTEDLSPP